MNCLIHVKVKILFLKRPYRSPPITILTTKSRIVNKFGVCSLISSKHMMSFGVRS